MAYGIIFGAMDKTTLYLPAILRRALADESRRAGRAQADLIREALNLYLAGRPRPLPQSIGIAADGKVTGKTSQAWLRREWAHRWTRSKRGRRT